MALDTDPGVGIGTPTTLVTGQCPNIPATYLSLEEYWDFLQINECAGYGIRNYPTTGIIGLGCGDYWNQSERFFLASAIAKSEQRLEADRWLGFPLRRKYEKPRQLEYRWPLYLGKYVRGIGIETNTLVKTSILTLSSGGSVNDPVEFTVDVSFTDEDELVIYYPGTTACKIRPSSVSIASGIATIKIPRCRLLKPEYFKDYVNDTDRPNYVDDSYFLDQVDIYRNYLDITTGANLVWWRHDYQVHGLCCIADVQLCAPSGPCADVKQLACPYVRNQRDGIVQLEPATYNGSWSKTSYAVKRKPDGVEVNYMRFYYDRYERMDESIMRAIIAMAHNNMPRSYCSCDQQSLYYDEDTKELSPPVRLGMGRSTWGLYYAEQIIREFDAKYNSHFGGML